MPIDPSIALSIKPVQIQDPLNRMAAMMQLESGQQSQQLNALQMKKAQQEFDTQNRLGKAWQGSINPDTGEIDYNSLLKNLSTDEIGANAIPGVIKARKDAELVAQQLKTQQSTESKNVAETKNTVLKNIREKTSDLQFNPYDDNVRAHAQDAILHGVWTPEQAAQNVAEALAIPIAQRPAYFAKKGLDAEKRVTTEETARANAERERNARRQTDISGGQLNLAERRFAAELNPDIQGNLAAAKKRAEENVKFETQGRIDIAANRKALKQAGYDPVTGTDDITNLIKESTGGYLGKGLDIGARVFGSATEGSKALAQLEQKGNAITFGLLNGKLGAGISTSDRQFIEALVSRISDGTLPVEDRLAAWTSAKDMMRTLGMVEPPTKSGSPKPSAAPSNQTKSGATVSNW